MKHIKKLLNRETLLYLIFGVATTVVNYVVFLFIYNVFFMKDHSLLANAIAFVAAVVFAFVVNKCFVFESKSWVWSDLRKEMSAFLAARIGSFAIEEAGLLCCEVMELDRLSVYVGDMYIDGIMAAKLILSVVVVILNYIFCKWFVFKNKSKKDEKSA